MALSFFKNADDLYAQGIDLIKQGDMDGARAKLMKSIEKDGGPDDLSRVIVALIDMRGKLGDPDSYLRLIEALKNCSTEDFEFGLTPLNTKTMITQCELSVEEIRLMNMNGGPEVLLEKGKRLIELAQKFQTQMGNDHLRLVEIYQNDTTRTGIRESMLLLAVAYESMATGTVWEDPRKAAEYQQIAYGYRKQIGDSGESNLKLIEEYSRSCKCWFCGRHASGEGIHFFKLSSDISPMLRKTDENEPLKSGAEGDAVYVCRACYTGIARKADEIAKGYYANAMSEIAAVEARLQSEIAALQSQILVVRR